MEGEGSGAAPAYTDAQGNGYYSSNPAASAPYAPHAPAAAEFAPQYSIDNENNQERPVTINGQQYYLNEMNLKGLHRILSENFGYSAQLLQSLNHLHAARDEIHKAMSIANAVQRSNSGVANTPPQAQYQPQHQQVAAAAIPQQGQIITGPDGKQYMVVGTSQQASPPPAQGGMMMMPQGQPMVIMTQSSQTTNYGNNNMSSSPPAATTNPIRTDPDTGCTDAWSIITFGFNVITFLLTIIFFIEINSDIQDFWDIYGENNDGSVSSSTTDCVTDYISDNDITTYEILAYGILVLSIACDAMGLSRFWCIRPQYYRDFAKSNIQCYLSIYFLLFAANMGCTIAMFTLNSSIYDDFTDVKNECGSGDDVDTEARDIADSIRTMWVILILLCLVPFCIIVLCARTYGHADVCAVACACLFCGGGR